MSKVIIAVVALVVVGGGAWALSSDSDDNATNSNTTGTAQTKPSTSSQTDEKQSVSTIVYDGTTFTPNQMAVKSGSKVTIKNTSSVVLELDSDPHPTHTTDKDLNVGIVAPGASQTFTVTKKGTFGYHNHIVPTQKGTIQVN